MNRQSAVIFPDTVPSEQICIPLVQVFEQLVYCQPVENDQNEQERGDLRKNLVDHVFCSFSVPAPLGQDRNRFMRLISDIRTRKDEYAAQLSHLSLASIPAGTWQRRETKSSIVANLLSSHGIREQGSEKKDMLLWQARLVLKLAELYDEDQRQLRLDMETITDREKGLFSELRSDPETPSTSTEKYFSSSAESAARQRLRLKAWARIFSLGTVEQEVPKCFVTTSAEAMDRLLANNEQQTGIRPLEFFHLMLPAQCPKNEIFSACQQQFNQDGAELREKLASILDNPSRISVQDKSLFSEEESPWADLLEQVFPSNDWGRCRLIMYNFPTISVRKLFLDTFGYDDDALQAEPLGDEVGRAIIGLLAPA